MLNRTDKVLMGGMAASILGVIFLPAPNINGMAAVGGIVCMAAALWRSFR